MKIIMDLVDKIDDEIMGAKEYAETYLELKASGDANWSNKFKSLAQQELEHSVVIHDYAIQKIEQLKSVYTPPVEMQEVWDKSHKRYIEKVAWIKQMLTI